MTIPIGLQLFSVRKECEQDLSGTLAAIARMGYQGVEFAGYYGYPAEELRRMTDDVGLQVCGSHIGLDTLLGDEFERTVEFSKTIGSKFLVVPGLSSERTRNRSAWLQTAGIFNEVAARLAPLGMYTGYHNHHIEFTPMEGEMPWDTFFGNTSPEVVMQIDLGNCLRGKGDPVQFLERYPGRAATVHLKEYSSTNDKAIIGKGDVRWHRVFELCETTGKTQWYIVEHETPAYPPLECVDRCLKALRQMRARQS